jgi:2-polyprenyl-3-methyl-5-hydroxy-6-metoxy-1,4-benzoquinol methylase
MTSKDLYRWVGQLCPICEVAPTKYLGRRGGEAHRQNLGVECEVWRCQECGLTFPNPMPIPLGGLDQHYAVSPDEYFQHHATEQKNLYVSMLMQQLKSLKDESGTLLDIGAGRGELLSAAMKEGWRAVGIETSSTFAAYAAQHTGAEIRREPLEECSFADESFDAVVLGAVLEHLYDPDQVIEEIARILRPGGVLFIDVPNEQGLYFRIGNLYQRLRLRDWVVNLAPTFSPFHVFGFSPKSLRALLSKHGLQPKIWYVFAGKSLIPEGGGLTGALEQQAANVVTGISSFGDLGAYIATWAVKVD